MDLNGLEEYINGLTKMASSCSTWIGCSEISAECYDPGDFRLQFAEWYELAPGKAELVNSGLTLRQELVRWLGGSEPKIADGLFWLLHGRLGDAKNVYRLKNEEELIGSLGWGEGGKAPYYFMEDLFFAEFERCTVCFMMGNNE